MQLVTCDNGRHVLSTSAWVNRPVGVRCGAAEIIEGMRRSEGTPRVVGKLRSCSKVSLAPLNKNWEFLGGFAVDFGSGELVALQLSHGNGLGSWRRGECGGEFGCRFWKAGMVWTFGGVSGQKLGEGVCSGEIGLWGERW